MNKMMKNDIRSMTLIIFGLLLVLIITCGFVIQYVEASPQVYKRSLYRHWIDADRNCRNTRQEVLIRDALHFELDESGCKVISGVWLDPYTNTIFTDPRKLDVDHVVPLKNVHESGGFAWDAKTRKAYANDLINPDHLLAVSASANRRKGARGPEDYMPGNQEYHCTYVRAWSTIKLIYGLTATMRERRKIQRVIQGCPQDSHVQMIWEKNR